MPCTILSVWTSASSFKMAVKYFELIFRLPFLLALEWFLAVDITTYSDSSYARFIQVSGRMLFVFFVQRQSAFLI